MLVSKQQLHSNVLFPILYFTKNTFLQLFGDICMENLYCNSYYFSRKTVIIAMYYGESICPSDLLYSYTFSSWRAMHWLPKCCSTQ